MRVSALAVYPLKGARAVPLADVELEPLGPAGDRRYCLARPGGRVFTQRDDPSLARLRAHHRAGGLALEFDGAALDVPADASSRNPACASGVGRPSRTRPAAA